MVQRVRQPLPVLGHHRRCNACQRVRVEVGVCVCVWGGGSGDGRHVQRLADKLLFVVVVVVIVVADWRAGAQQILRNQRIRARFYRAGFIDVKM